MNKKITLVINEKAYFKDVIYFHPQVGLFTFLEVFPDDSIKICLDNKETIKIENSKEFQRDIKDTRDFDDTTECILTRYKNFKKENTDLYKEINTVKTKLIEIEKTSFKYILFTIGKKHNSGLVLKYNSLVEVFNRIKNSDRDSIFLLDIEKERLFNIIRK